MSDEVVCEQHGARAAAFVCGHLIGTSLTSMRRGFNYLNEPEFAENGEPCAWCDQCEALRLSIDGWDEVSEKAADIKLVCLSCFDEMKSLNGGGRLIP